MATLAFNELKSLNLRFEQYNPETATKGVTKKGVLKNFAKFTGKHLCQSLY